MISVISLKRACILFAVLLLALAGCGTGVSAGDGTDSEKKDDGYTITVTDSKRNPIENVTVTVCDDSTCIPHTTDKNGVINFTAKEYPYILHVIKAPEGFANDPEEDFTFPEGKKKVTIQLK